MKKIFVILLLLIGSLNLDADAKNFIFKEKPIIVRSTAYTHSERGHEKYGKATAVGTKLKYGNIISCAADWSLFPLGTKFKIKGDSKIYLVEDFGSALVGKKTIDIYKPNKQSMNSWGAKNIEIIIIERGDPKKSYEFLMQSGRQRYWHCREMARYLRKEIA